jgi:signal transduction histidine kinase
MLLTLARGRQQRLPLAQLVLAAVIALWAGLMIALGQGELAVRAPVTRGAMETVVAFAALFGALVMLLFPQQDSGRRLWWLAAALIVIGVSAIAFGASRQFTDSDEPASASAYAWLATRLVASLFLCFAVAGAPPAARRRRAVVVVALVGAAWCIAVELASPLLPVLIHGSTSSEHAYATGARGGLTAAYWVTSCVPLALAFAAMLRAPRVARATDLPWWFTPALVLFAAGQMHGELWPSAYTSIVTLSDLLRLAFVLLVAAGAAVTLLRVADEREAMLALEQTRTRELGELAEAHRDVTAIVTHELAAPLGAIRRLVDTVGTGELSPPEQGRALVMIEAEAGMLSALVADIQSLTMADRSEFPVDLQPVRLSDLVRTAAVFAESLPGYHPLNVDVTLPDECDVMADPQRLAQVLRNLVGNAAKFSNPGSPIDLRASAADEDCVVVEVSDEGWGIAEEDLDRIFEKYRRGSPHGGPRPGGLGVGLYLSQRIVEAHGSRIDVESEPGKGSTFRFELKSVQ